MLPIPYNKERLMSTMYGDPMFAGEMLKRITKSAKKLDEKLKKIESGELTHKEAFGDSMSGDELRMYMYDMHPDWPAKYKLPSHWHWVGR